MAGVPRKCLTFDVDSLDSIFRKSGIVTRNKKNWKKNPKFRAYAPYQLLTVSEVHKLTGMQNK